MKKRSDLNQINRSEAGQWAAETIGQVAIFCLLFMALLGVFGAGPLSQRTIRSHDDTFVIHYDSILRAHAPSEIVMEVIPQNTRPMKLRISDRYVSKLQIEQIIPTPTTLVADGDFLLLTIPHSSSKAPVHIRLRLKPESMGYLTGIVSIDEIAEVKLQQFVYP